MAYTIQFAKTDTLAATLNSGETSTTLTNGNFGSPSGTQLYVVDYDVSAKAEIISASVAGTAVTGITRGLSGGAAGTTDHAAGAKIGSIFVPQHYKALTDGSGFETGTSSVGIPVAAMKQEAFTTWTASPTGFSATSTNTARYIRIGNLVAMYINFTGTSNATTFTFTLPVAAKAADILGPCRVQDNGTLSSNGIIQLSAASTTATVNSTLGGGAFTASGSKSISGYFVYEAQ